MSCHRSAHSPASHLLSLFRVHASLLLLWAFPPLGGRQSVHLASICNSVQAEILLDQVAWARAFVIHWVHNLRKPKGMFLMVGTNCSWINERLGRALDSWEEGICWLLVELSWLLIAFKRARLRAVGLHDGQLPWYLEWIIFPHTLQTENPYWLRKSWGTAPERCPKQCAFKWFRIFEKSLKWREPF